MPIIYLLILLIISCTNEKQKNPRQIALEQKIKAVAKELSDLGIKIELEKLNLAIKNPKEIENMFSSIESESKKDMNSFISFAPKTGPANNLKHEAFYDPNTKTIVISENINEQQNEGLITHELIHAYQDQKWGFSNIWSSYKQNPSEELFNITEVIIEGHAEFIRLKLEQRKKSFACISCQYEDTSLNTPYRVGLKFFLNLYKKTKFSLLENIFDNFPSSTEQLLHPKKFGLDYPSQVKFKPWEDNRLKPKLIWAYTLGEAFLLNKLGSLGLNELESKIASSGWDGDIAHYYKTIDNSEVLIWRIVFDRNLDVKQLHYFHNLINGPGILLKEENYVDWIVSNNKEAIESASIWLTKNKGSFIKNKKDQISTSSEESSLIQ